MKLSSFLKLVEIQTKLASIIPFILGTLYTLYRYNNFNFENFLIMFISLLVFDMATTAINNYCDYKNEIKLRGSINKSKNIIVGDNIKETTVLLVIYLLLTIAVVFGVILTLRTNIVVLLVGMLSFVVGILYTFGPVPISRMPLGEVFSGFFMGFVILFLSIYIHIYDQNIVSLIYKNNMLSLNVNIVEITYIFLISIPAVSGIANIMLANNICDLEEDIKIKRFTLPYYIGKENALRLFKTLYYISYISVVILVILKVAPIASLLVLVTLIPINKNINIFYNKPIKGETFVLAVKNFALMNLSYIVIIGIVVMVRFSFK